MAYTRKIFGIGLSRTGTTSLSRAFETLGIRTKHFPCDDVTYDELTSGHYHLTIMEHFQAVTDTPVAPFYAQLDRAFPGSKFVLTVREKGAWLRSVESHWKLLDQQCESDYRLRRFTDFIHACAYGSLAFNAERFSYAYDLHEKNVKSYFYGRQRDLLVVDICGGAGWHEVCSFLDMPVPKAPFPHSNRSAGNPPALWESLRAVIPSDCTFILVGAEQMLIENFHKGRVLPFLERDGLPWGLPASDSNAQWEVERMRKEGAQFIVFTWSTFWWLDHYSEFYEYLRSHYACVAEDKDVVAFDLR